MVNYIKFNTTDMKYIKLFLVVAIFAMIASRVSAQDDMKKIYQANYDRALVYNDFFEAKSALYKLVIMEPENDSLLATLAYLYFDARQYASNVLICMDVLKLNPNNTSAMEMIAISYENLGLKDKALEYYEKLYLKTNDFQLLYKMAFFQYDLSKFLQSITNIDFLLQQPEAEEATVFFTIEDEEKEFPIKTALFNLKGLVNKELGNIVESRQNYEEALKLSPDFIFAKENMEALDN